MEIKFRALKADEIECRISTVTEKGVSLLLYKDARCDMNILDEAVGPMNWMRHHSRDNANCIVSLWERKVTPKRRKVLRPILSNVRALIGELGASYIQLHLSGYQQKSVAFMDLEDVIIKENRYSDVIQNSVLVVSRLIKIRRSYIYRLLHESKIQQRTKQK